MESNLEMLIERLKKEGRVQTISYAEMQSICKPINEHMEEVHKEFLYKEARSWESASKVYFTA